MCLENPSEAFIIESFTSATRYYSPSLKRLVYALCTEQEGKTFFFFLRKYVIEEACHPGQLGGHLLKL